MVNTFQYYMQLDHAPMSPTVQLPTFQSIGMKIENYEKDHEDQTNFLQIPYKPKRRDLECSWKNQNQVYKN